MDEVVIVLFDGDEDVLDLFDGHGRLFFELLGHDVETLCAALLDGYVRCGSFLGEVVVGQHVCLGDIGLAVADLDGDAVSSAVADEDVVVAVAVEVVALEEFHGGCGGVAVVEDGPEGAGDEEGGLCRILFDEGRSAADGVDGDEHSFLVDPVKGQVGRRVEGGVMHHGVIGGIDAAEHGEVDGGHGVVDVLAVGVDHSDYSLVIIEVASGEIATVEGVFDGEDGTSLGDETCESLSAGDVLAEEIEEFVGRGGSGRHVFVEGVVAGDVHVIQVAVGAFSQGEVGVVTQGRQDVERGDGKHDDANKGRDHCDLGICLVRCAV